MDIVYLSRVRVHQESIEYIVELLFVFFFFGRRIHRAGRGNVLETNAGPWCGRSGTATIHDNRLRNERSQREAGHWYIPEIIVELQTSKEHRILRFPDLFT